MATVVIGCDRNNGSDSKWQNTVANALKKAGHTVEKLSITSNAFADYSYQSKAKGKIGVYIIADGIFSIADLTFGSTKFKYGYFIIRGDLGRSKMNSWSDFKNNPIGRDPDCTSICNKIAGKTYSQMNEICKSKCQITFGKTAKEGADNLIKLMGGKSSSSSSSKSSSVSSIKTCLQELLYPWNGEVYCFLRADDTINIGRIPGPTKTRLSLVEGENVHLEGISLTDIDPKAPNKLVVNWGNKQFVLKDESRIKRFGEKKKSISTNLKSESSVIDFAYKQFQKMLRNGGRVLECKVDGSPDWHIGNWVRVYIPSLELNGYMYITKTAHDDNGEWDTSLTLKDYPPDLGTKPSQTNKDSK